MGSLAAVDAVASSDSVHSIRSHCGFRFSFVGGAGDYQDPTLLVGSPGTIISSLPRMPASHDRMKESGSFSMYFVGDNAVLELQHRGRKLTVGSVSVDTCAGVAKERKKYCHDACDHDLFRLLLRLSTTKLLL